MLSIKGVIQGNEVVLKEDINKIDGRDVIATIKEINIDHVTPIDTINKAYPKLSNDQKKKLANQSTNLAVTSSHINRSQGCSANSEYIDKQLRMGKNISIENAGRVLDKQLESEKVIRKMAKKMQRDNAVSKLKKIVMK